MSMNKVWIVAGALFSVLSLFYITDMYFAYKNYKNQPQVTYPTPSSTIQSGTENQHRRQERHSFRSRTEDQQHQHQFQNFPTEVYPPPPTYNISSKVQTEDIWRHLSEV